LIYIASIVIGNLLKEKKKEMARAFAAFSDDLGFKSFFFFSFSLLMHNMAPVPIGVVLVYLYLITIPILLLAHMKPEKWIFKLIAFAVQTVICLLMVLIVLADPWCRFAYLRSTIN